MLVQRLGAELHALFQQELEEMGQHGGIEAHGVLHQQDSLHAHLLYVLGGVHLVFYQFDYGKYEVHVPQP